jgi:hypothetical protein
MCSQKKAALKATEIKQDRDRIIKQKQKGKIRNIRRKE